MNIQEFIREQPSSEDCNKKRILYQDGEQIIFATWYPQMGGYGSKCIVCTIVDSDACFDCYVWHDGDWPFHEDQPPREMHHCMAEQFINFGLLVQKMQGGLLTSGEEEK